MSKTLHDIRFGGDQAAFDALLEDEHLAGPLRSRAGYEQHRKTVRMRLLSTAVRVDPRMLPGLDASIAVIRERACYDDPVEAYVFEDPTINAFMTQGEKQTLLGISSGAVERLKGAELEFVIGHELGHALFRHFDAHVVLQSEELLDIKQRQQLYAWRRASEISADRCGLICCGSVDVAATAMFRSLSGLGKTLQVRAEDFAEQWDHLQAELSRGGDDELWESTHPLPPLRMKAMLTFWNADAPLLPADRPAPRHSLEDADEQIKRLLAIMDPLARAKRGGDPLLEDFCLWGGLCLVTANGGVDEAGKAALQTFVPPAMVDSGLQGGVGKETLLANFQEALGRRRKRLKSLEMTKILKSILAVGHAKGKLTDKDVEAFNALGEALGIAEHACDLIRERYLEEKQG